MDVCLLYSKFLLVTLCLFVFGATFAASNWQFISICSCVIGGYFGHLKHPWLSD